MYIIYLSTNQTYYSNQFLLYAIESTAQPNFTYPTGFPFSTNWYCPRFIFQTGTLKDILGFTNGNYPTPNQTTNQSILSNVTPNLTPVNGIILRCNIVNNERSSQSDILDTLIISSSIGSNIY